jgi:hypothetical protein
LFFEDLLLPPAPQASCFHGFAGFRRASPAKACPLQSLSRHLASLFSGQHLLYRPIRKAGQVNLAMRFCGQRLAKNDFLNQSIHLASERSNWQGWNQLPD